MARKSKKVLAAVLTISMISQVLFGESGAGTVHADTLNRKNGLIIGQIIKAHPVAGCLRHCHGHTDGSAGLYRIREGSGQ